MPQLGSLQIPDQGRGRSRFSKALPAIPPIDTSVADEEPRAAPTLLSPSNVSLPASKTVTPVNLGDLPPPPPPRHNDDPRVPIQYTPLPPIPASRRTSKTTLMTPTTPTSGPQKMKIPRRPVGSKQKAEPANPQTQTSQTQTQTQTPTETFKSTAAPTPTSAAVPQSQISPPTFQSKQKELPPQLPAFRTSVFAIEQAPPALPAKAVERQAPSPQIQVKNQWESTRKEPAPEPEPEPELKRERESEGLSEASVEEEQPRSSIQLQTELFPKPPSSTAFAVQPTRVANGDMKAYQEPQKLQEPREPPEPSPQTVEYLQPSEFPQPMKSPSDSLSSILSAYSRSSTQSIIRSSDGTYSTRDSHAQESPSHHISSSTTGSNTHYHEPSTSVSTITPSTAVPQAQSQPQRGIANGNDFNSSPPAPPPPSKDYVSQRPVSPPARGVAAHPELVTASPPKEQIWRRRSLKGSRELPNLQLDYSHGSTASTASAGTTQSQSTEVPARTQQEITPARPAPRPPPKEVNGLPGRNIRPAHLQKQSTDEPTMGHGGSRLQQLKDKFHRSRKSEDKDGSRSPAQDSGNGQQNNQPAGNRPPTPEYQNEDIRAPHVDRITSPASPASSPEPKAGPSRQPQQRSSQADEPPPAPPAKNDSRPVGRKQLPEAGSAASGVIPSNDGPSDPRSATSSTISPAPRPSPAGPSAAGPSAAGPSAPGPSLLPARSLPDLKTRGTPTPATEPFPPFSAFPASGRNSPAPEARGRQFEGPGRLPASRESSARPESRRGFDPARNSGPDQNRIVQSSTGELCYRGRDGTLYPEMKESAQAPDPRAMRFPALGGQPIPEGTILQAAPLKDSHYGCYHKHRSMLRQRNRRYPLTCQTCQKADAEDRWSCSFCSLRICESCLGIFESNKKDLTTLMNELAGKKTLSLSSGVRPGSSLGLSTMS